MSEKRGGPATPGGRALVLLVVGSVALAGVGAFAVGGSSATRTGGPAEWSPVSGKEVTSDEECEPPEEDPSTENDTDDTTGSETDASGYQLRITYDGEWRGTIVTENSDVPIEGSGDETIDIEADEDARIAASVSKTDISDETMEIELLLNGLVIDKQIPAEPDVDNFDDVDDGSSTVDDTSADSTFESTSDTSSTTGSDGWETFGDNNESSPFDDSSGNSFGDESVTADEDSFGDDTTNDTDTDTETANDSAFSAETSGSAQVVFANQTVTGDGTDITVESATSPDGGFVVIHNESLMQGEDNVRSSMIGVSRKLDAEQNEDIEIDLAINIEESQQLYAVLYRDADDDGNFEYGGTTEDSDEPYLNDNDMTIYDNATVTVPRADSTSETADTSVFGSENDSTTTSASTDESVFAETATATETPTATDDGSAASSESGTEAAPAVSPSTAMSGNAAEETTETNAPGFGMGVAIVALLGLALLATRQN